MIYKDLHKFIKAVKARTYNLEVRYNKKKISVLISVFFIKNSIKFIVFDNENRFVLSEIKNKILIKTPDTVSIELKREHKIEIFKLVLNENKEEHTIKDSRTNENNSRTTINNSRINENHTISNEIILNTDQTNETQKLERINPQLVESLVNKAIEEDRRERECNETLRKLDETNELVKRQTNNIEELEQKLLLKAQEIQELERIINNKSNIEHYALLAGDIASKIGFDKEKLKNIFSGTKTDDNTNKTDDNSGIIEDNTS